MLESIQAPLRQTFEDHRSLSILAFYLTLCATLALNICIKIYRRYKIRKVRASWSSTHGPIFTLFLILAAVSLATTWYYMFAFFQHSYNSWLAEQGSAQQALIEAESYPVKWELWLRDRKLFREAWESVSETPAKFWWSGQIFLWTIGWSLFLGVMSLYSCIPPQACH
jgi:amino acid transporter